MRTAAYRAVSLVLAAVFVLSGFVSGTLGWHKSEGDAAHFHQPGIW